MCITFIARNGKYKFALLFNRDEFFHRLTYPLGFNYQKDHLYKDFLFFPLDCISGGTFLCLNVKNGNFAVLLNNNFKTIPYNPNAKLKRADLPIDFCKGDLADKDYYESFFKILEQNKMDYNGFNFLCGNMRTDELLYYTNNTENKNNNIFVENTVMTEPIALSENLLGLCNAFYDDQDSIYACKVKYGKEKLEQILTSNAYETEKEFVSQLFYFMQDDKKLICEDELPSDKHNLLKEGLKNTKLKEHLVSSIFVKDSLHNIFFEYGTRHTIIVILDYEGNLKIYEQCDEIEEPVENQEKKILKISKRSEGNIKFHEFKLNQI